MPTISSPTPDATTTSKGKIQLAGALAGTAAAPTLASTPSWTIATLATGWAYFDTGAIPITTTNQYRYPRYFKDLLGIVHITGMIKNNSGAANTSSTNATIFTFPAGFIPGHTQRIIVDGNDAFCEIDIQPTGALMLAGSASIANGAWVSLNNIHFYAEQ